MNPLDAIIGFFSPRWGAERLAARATMAQVNAMTGGRPGYAAGKINRLNGPRAHEVKANAIDVSQYDHMLADAWALYRDNPYVRKIVSSLQSKVIGPGLQPESMATNADGSVNMEFRSRAKSLWQGIQSGFDIRGLPGKGGQTLGGLQRLALQADILSGDVMYRLVPLTASEALARDLPVPLALQLIDTSRLARDGDINAHQIAEGHQVYRGIEIDADGQRVAYWINTNKPGKTEFIRRPASEIGHLYIEDDIDQYRGVTWFAASLIPIRDTGDLQYNVLKASAMAACVVGSYTKPTGAARFGLGASTEAQPGTADGTDLTDVDGNAITKLQPAMMLNVGRDGKFELHSPNQGHMNPEAFVQHMLRGVAAGTPGIKSSTVTGDYRNSSFSSEKSADNDIWPEVESIQDWFAANFCQPIYESVIRAAMLTGYFDGVVSAEEFAASPSRFTRCNWQGPVGRSINPTDDAEAAGMRMQKGISSLQMECAKVNVNWLDVLSHADELYQTAKAKGLPPEVVNNILGIGANDVIAQTNKANGTRPEQGEPRSLKEQYKRERMADALAK